MEETKAPMPTFDPSYVARKTPGAGLKDYEHQIDMAALRRYRLERVRQKLIAADYGACVLFDPINIRYATGTRNMQVFCMHHADRYVFVPAEGPVVLFDGYMAKHPIDASETVDERRPATTWYYETKGPNVLDAAKRWAAEIADLVGTHCGGNRRLAIDRLGAVGFEPLISHGLEIMDGQAVLEQARAIKSPEEVACMCFAISVCEAGMARMREALRPGISENHLWSLLVQANVEQGGEWMDTRLLASGGRTNPWYQECGEKLIRIGDLVAFDTDLIGPFGYCADISRTFHCGPGKPSETQKRLYRHAYEQIQYNIALPRPGMAFREYAEQSWKIPEEFLANRYMCLAHGVGMVDEYPDIVHPLDWEETGYDGVIEENMTLCVESYIGEEGGAEGVKLEEQVLVTAEGVQILSTFPFEEELLG
jgi:Xaa-Pro aminopeptidase